MRRQEIKEREEQVSREGFEERQGQGLKEKEDEREGKRQEAVEVQFKEQRWQRQTEEAER